MFRFPEPVTVDSGHSLLVPFIADSLPARRMSLYQPTVHARHPLSTIRLENAGQTGLPPGVLTLFERDPGDQTVSYVGDARLGAFPAGEDRLISFAVDQRVRIDTENRGTSTLVSGQVVDGVLRLSRNEQRTVIYTITGAAREDRLVAIEHTRLDGWDLVLEEDLEVEETDTAYRIYRQVPAGEVVMVRVTQERPTVEQLALVNLADAQISFYAGAGELSDAIRAAMGELSELRANVADATQALRVLEERQRMVIEDQGRIRRNLGSVPRESDLYQRYLQTLGEQEDELEQLVQQIVAANAAVVAARQAVTDYVRDLNGFDGPDPLTVGYAGAGGARFRRYRSGRSANGCALPKAARRAWGGANPLKAKAERGSRRRPIVLSANSQASCAGDPRPRRKPCRRQSILRFASPHA